MTAGPEPGLAPGAAVLRGWAVAAVDLVFPARCTVCGTGLGVGRRDPLCGGCFGGIERISPPYCARCGVPFVTFEQASAPRLVSDLCQGCLTASPAFDYARAAGRFAGPLREALHALKFRGRRAVARPLATLVAEQCRHAVEQDVAALVPVPLARDRERARGFNQAGLIAERLGTHLGVPVRARWARRLRTTLPQSELSGPARQANVRQAFGASAEVAGLHVIVVDDVLTTGATVGDCARALRAAGARRVGVLTVARVA